MWNRAKKRIAVLLAMVMVVGMFAGYGVAVAAPQGAPPPQKVVAEAPVRQSFERQSVAGQLLSGGAGNCDCDPSCVEDFHVRYLRTEWNLGLANEIFVITTLSELNGGTLPSVVTEPYSAAFFETHYLVIVRLPENSGSNWHIIEAISDTGDIHITRVRGLTTDMSGWHIVIELCRDFAPGPFHMVITEYWPRELIELSFADFDFPYWRGHTFPAAAVGYGPQTPLTVEVRNGGTWPRDEVIIALLENPAAGSFTLNRTSLPSLAAGETTAFTITPNTGLAAGTHTAYVAVFIPDRDLWPWRFQVSFTVEASINFHLYTNNATLLNRFGGYATGVSSDGHPVIEVPVVLGADRSTWPDQAALAAALGVGNYGVSESWSHVVGHALWGWFDDETLDPERTGRPLRDEFRRPALADRCLLEALLVDIEDGAIVVDGDLDLFAVWSIWGDVDDNGAVEGIDILRMEQYLFDETWIEAGWGPFFDVPINTNAGRVTLGPYMRGMDILRMEQYLFDRAWLLIWPFFRTVLGQP